MCISERCRHVRHNGARGGAFGAARDHIGMEWRRPAPGEGRSAKYDSEISQQTDKQKMYHGARTDDAGTIWEPDSRLVWRCRMQCNRMTGTHHRP